MVFFSRNGSKHLNVWMLSDNWYWWGGWQLIGEVGYPFEWLLDLSYPVVGNLESFSKSIEGQNYRQSSGARAVSSRHMALWLAATKRVAQFRFVCCCMLYLCFPAVYQCVSVYDVSSSGLVGCRDKQRPQAPQVPGLRSNGGWEQSMWWVGCGWKTEKCRPEREGI